MKKKAIHPGHILQKIFMEPQCIAPEDLAVSLKIKQSTLTRVIKGQQSITTDLSLKLSDYFQTTPEFWISLQINYDQSEASRGTDDPFYSLMQISGDALLKLIGIQSNKEYEPRAVVLKEKRLYPDIIAFPKHKDREIVVIEFQGYKEPMMRYIISSKITTLCTQENYTGPVLGAIVYTDKDYQKASLPFSITSQSGNFWIKGQFIEIDLSTYTEKDLIDIDQQLIVLAPFTLPKNYPKNEYIHKCRSWKKQIDQTFSQETVTKVMDILSLFILDRQRNMTRKEVLSMYKFDISQTVVGQELLKEGLEAGKKEGIKEGKKEGEKIAAIRIIGRQMSKKFDVSMNRIAPRLNALPIKDIMDLGEDLLSMETFKDAYTWINHRKKKINK